MAQGSPAWSDEFQRTATVDTLRQVPENAIHTLDTHKMEDFDAISIVIKAQIRHNQAADRERLGLPPKPPPSRGLFDAHPPGKDPIVEVVLRNDFEDFGFLVYRQNFDDDPRWQRWEEAFLKLMEESVEEATGGVDIMDRLYLPMCVDTDLKNLPWEGLSDYHHLFRQNHPQPPGIDVGAAVVVDKGAMDSLLEPQPGVPPWVWIMDEHFDFTTLDDLPENEYDGHFPIAINSLLPNLYPLLASGAMSLKQLEAAWTFDDNNPVWLDSVQI